MKICDAIRERRKELNLTLEEVGDACGVTKSAVWKWENGSISSIKSDIILKLATVLKCNPVDLVKDEVEKLNEFSFPNEMPHLTEKQDAALEKMKKLSPENFEQAKQFIEFLLIQQRDEESD